MLTDVAPSLFRANLATAVALAILLAACRIAAAQDCTNTLIPRTTNVTYSKITDLALAYQLSESSFNKAKQDFGASAVVYGIPIGGNYSQYHEEARRRAEQLGYRNFQQLSFAYATSGLDETNLQIFRECIASQSGWGITLKERADEVYKLFITSRRGHDTRTNLKATIVRSNNIAQRDINSVGAQLASHDFSDTLDIEFTIRPNDPRKQASLDIEVGGRARAIVLPPLVAVQISPIVFASTRYIDSSSIGIARTTDPGNENWKWGVGIANARPDTAGHNRAFYIFDAPQEGIYTMQIEYASRDERTVDIFVNDQYIERALHATTGGFCMDAGQSELCPPDVSHLMLATINQPVRLNEGQNRLVLDRLAPFPHIKTIKFTYLRQ